LKSLKLISVPPYGTGFHIRGETGRAPDHGFAHYEVGKKCF
jgi:hypothetical protein